MIEEVLRMNMSCVIMNLNKYATILAQNRVWLSQLILMAEGNLN